MPKANMDINYQEMLDFRLRQWDKAIEEMRQVLSDPSVTSGIYNSFRDAKSNFDWSTAGIWKLKSLIAEIEAEMAATSTTTQEPVN